MLMLPVEVDDYHYHYRRDDSRTSPSGSCGARWSESSGARKSGSEEK